MNSIKRALPPEATVPSEVLAGALNLGERLLMYGGEPYRVEDTIRRICMAYGAERVGVFTITSTIVVTAYFPDVGSITSSRRVTSISTDYEMVHRLNALSRKACLEPFTANELQAAIDDLDNNCPKYSFKLQALWWAIISGAFTVFFGGSYADCIVAALIGASLRYFSRLFVYLDVPAFFSTFALSLIGGLFSRLALTVGFEISIYMVNVGVVMLLIPGIMLTNSIRDLALGDFISGLMRFLEALLLSIAIAWAFAVTAGALPESVSTSKLISILSAGIGSTAFCLYFNVRGKEILACSFGGFFSWSIVLLMMHLGLSEYGSYFISSICFAVYAQIMARIFRSPASIFAACASFPLIPGAALYRAMCCGVHKMWYNLGVQGLGTLIYAITISAGILCVMVFMRSAAKVKADRNAKEEKDSK